MEKNFNRVRSTKDIIISFSLIIIGCVFVTLPNSDAVNIAGFFTIIAGLLLAFIMKTSYKDAETGEIYSKKERFFAQSRHEQLKQSLTYPSQFCSKGENEGNTLRLDVYYNKKKIFIQMLEYVPYTYEPCTKFYEHDISNGAKFIYN